MLRARRGNHFQLFTSAAPIQRSMAELDADVERASAALRSRGLEVGQRVGFVGATSYRWIVCDLACLAIGLVTVPFDPETKPDLQEVARRYDLALVLTDRPTGEGASGCPELHFDAVDAPPPETRPEPAQLEPGVPFTFIFTSGTSGEPKAIEVRKRCFDDQFSNALRLLPVTERDKMLVFLPMHVYLERCYVYLAILCGFDLAITTPRHLLKALSTAGVTFTVGVPHFFQSVQDFFLLEVRRRRWLDYLLRARRWAWDHGFGFLFRQPFFAWRRAWGGRPRFFLTGSARCNLETLRFYQAMGTPLYEGYGMSEIAGMVALSSPAAHKLGSVGKVFPNKEVRLDAMGQIMVRGPATVGLGYFGVPQEQSAATYQADGWIATGDVGHFDSEGYLTIDGRLKDVIVLSNGKKVQPGPLESRINGHELIDNSVVLGDERPYLVALVTLKQGAAPTEIDQYIQSLNRDLPEGERVKRYRILEERFSVDNGLLNRSLKVDRRQVKARYAELLDELYAP